MKLKDILKEAVAEISYKKSGLKKPNLADLDKDKEISSYEKKRGAAIEKSMKTEFKTQAPKKEGIRFGNEERPMETMPSLSRSEMVAMNSRNNICKECGASMMYEDKMCAECGYMEEDGDATSLPSSLINGPVKNDEDGYSEGMDHEVSMAQNSLKAIVSAASELMNKMGEEEKDVPAWIQDHITNAANYIQQASQNYHEYGEPKHKDGVNLEDLMEAKISKICIENPIGVISTKIRKPDQIIQPWQFGHGETKATCLWLKNLPLLTPTNIVEGREARVHRMPPGPDRWKERSRTYQGIADAMAAQWG
jgi:hypothetical protein